MHADLAIDEGWADENIDDYNPTREPFIERSLNILNSYNIDTSYMTPESKMISPPWALHNISVCRDMYQFKKQEYQLEEMKSLFYEHLALHNNSFKIYTDGSKTEHGVGYAYIGDGMLFHEGSRILHLSLQRNSPLYKIV